jgi:hypothetical protein
MNRFITVLLIGHVLFGCGSETSSEASGSEGASASASASSGGSPECGLQGPPTGSCSASDECDFSDGGCSFDSYCKDGTWATVRTCSAKDTCPREAITAGSSCEDDGALCRYDEGGACVSDLKCTGGVWIDSGC